MQTVETLAVLTVLIRVNLSKGASFHIALMLLPSTCFALALLGDWMRLPSITCSRTATSCLTRESTQDQIGFLSSACLSAGRVKREPARAFTLTGRLKGVP